jgi:hypothetical protein
MKKETPRSLKREAGLADGLKTVAPGAECLPRAETQGKAQSERAKRGLRHIDPGVASRARSAGTGSRHRLGQKRRLGSGQQIVGGMGTNPANMAGLVVLCLRSGSLQPAELLSTPTVFDF